MTHNDNLQLIREKCIAANPELVEIKKHVIRNGFGEKESTQEVRVVRPIHLADVLLAIETFKPSWNIGVRGDGTLISGTMTADLSNFSKWNLRTDDLEQQSPETITFLAELLS